MTTALYRRYRPETFADVIGQEHVTEPLSQALRTGRVHHAYLFSGPRGCGKTTSARILARCLNCEQGPTPTPCGVCGSCVALARSGSGSVDVIEIDAASHGGVDDARDLRERASYGPASSRYKIYIIDEAHMATPQGFNALLKIVEEPPEHVKFVFATTEPDKVIGTIRSRTHHYPFRLVAPQRLQDYLARLAEAEGVDVAPGVLSFVVRAGGGSVRDALSILDQLIAGSGSAGLTYESAAALLGFTDAELLDASIDALAARDGAAVFHQIDKVIESGHDPRRFVEDLLERLRDLIVLAAVPDGASSVLRGLPADQVDRMRQQASAFGPGALSRAADIVNAGLTEMTGATAPRLQLELICARMLLPGASGESGYAARLDRLERRLAMAPTAPAPSASATSATSGAAAAGAPVPTAGPSAESKPQRPELQRPDPQRSESQRPDPQRAEPQRREPQRPETLPPGPTTPATGPALPAGGLDTAALRRAWPDVLTHIYGIKRLTWTFLSEHAQVLDYDGSRLLLGISTSGLLSTFRRGQHAELVRQAIVEVLGVEVVVEGVSPDAAERRAPAGPARPRPQDTGDHTVESREQSEAPAEAPAAPVRSARQRAQDTVARETQPQAQPAEVAAAWRDTGPAGAAVLDVGPGPVGSGRPIETSGTDDSSVSEDDETVENELRAGPEVISHVLGGTVIGELEQ